jgi:glycosyltransferase involved in cell wall biosynthesis
MNVKVLIDTGPLSSGDSIRGIGVYARELINAFRTASNKKGTVVAADIAGKDLSDYDVVHFTAFKPFSVSFPWKKPAGTKFIATIYDLIPLIYPRHYPSGIKGFISWRINKYLIRNRIDAVITITETSKKDICRFTGIDPNRVHVIYLAARKTFRKKEAKNRKTEIGGVKIPDRFALYVGDINYNKNIPNLVKACKIAGILLVIAGKQAFRVGEIDLNHPELSHLKGIDWSGVIRLGFVSDEELVELYNLATLYIQPSLYEGFGLPVLEAVACGTPVVAAKTQALVEVLGKDFNYVDGSDPKAMAESILNPNRDIQLPEVYSWEKTADETLELYEKV